MMLYNSIKYVPLKWRKGYVNNILHDLGIPGLKVGPVSYDTSPQVLSMLPVLTKPKRYRLLRMVFQKKQFMFPLLSSSL